ncbi:MAG: F0F1 ATP synthase subunit B [Lachnospiraceae bacterium]|nr:F0F1 ATP synthase subunit B [Lachnospiraceae bacterium]MBQ2022617.1 F0F1 ATP synthase subunit B [Lachnospiraceae bacterium]MBQ2106361.1 F0F1 ATP synthase subunit B [Lachnospiraceae bacterium]MBQ2404156.1 F0F1 ATP synthase subunit B [Lachnospiraceae bacterium]MBQ2426434.1 F0F1 ATP synthase subunit B [Lachnospiraceae bacterium]
MFESFIGINFWTAFFVLMNTLAIFFVAKKFLFVPVKNMIDSRQKEIDAMYDAAGAAKESAQALENEYKEKLAQAQQTSDRMVKDAVARGQNRQDEIISQANAEARAILDKAAADIAQEKKKALNDAKNEISELAMAIAEKVVGRELNDVDQAKLVDEFINELGD